jgi:ribosomal-protein-alanine N-acetyltransferase
MLKNKINFTLLLITIIALTNFYPISGNKLAIVARGVKKFSTYFTNFTPIETDRLILRKVQASDIEDVFEFMADEQMTKYTPLFTPAKSKDDAVKFTQNILDCYEKGEPTYFGIIYKETNKLVGLIHVEIETCFRASISYLVNPAYWSKGIATEATKTIINFGFNTMGLKRIEATCDPRNTASVKVLEKCGMSYEGTLKSYFCVNGEFCDRRLYAIIKP